MGRKSTIWKARCSCGELITEGSSSFTEDRAKCAAGHWSRVEWIKTATDLLEPKLHREETDDDAEQEKLDIPG
jgi:hypothetical protein